MFSVSLDNPIDIDNKYTDRQAMEYLASTIPLSTPVGKEIIIEPICKMKTNINKQNSHLSKLFETKSP